MSLDGGRGGGGRASGSSIPDAYSVAPAGIFVAAGSPVRTPDDLAGVPISVGYQSGSHYSTIQTLEQYMPAHRINLSFNDGMLFRRMELLIEGAIPAAALFSGPYYFAEQLGFRKILDSAFMITTMIHGAPDPEDLAKFFRALRRAQRDIDLRPDLYTHYYRNEFPVRFHPLMDTRRWGPGERLVFEPYTKEDSGDLRVDRGSRHLRRWRPGRLPVRAGDPHPRAVGDGRGTRDGLELPLRRRAPGPPRRTAGLPHQGAAAPPSQQVPWHYHTRSRTRSTSSRGGSACSCGIPRKTSARAPERPSGEPGRPHSSPMPGKRRTLLRTPGHRRVRFRAAHPWARGGRMRGSTGRSRVSVARAGFAAPCFPRARGPGV